MTTLVELTMESNSQTAPVPRVLVVEDEPDIAALIAYQLTREGFRVETAGNGPTCRFSC
jgi:CheY-like chemotaxis protein